MSFKDEEIQRLLDDLERSKSSIMVAFQAYSWCAKQGLLYLVQILLTPDLGLATRCIVASKLAR